MAQTISTPNDGATVVITHRIRSDKLVEYESWLEEISPLCKASVGYLDWHIIRPIPGITETYTVIIRFDTCYRQSKIDPRLQLKIDPLFQ